MEEAWKKEFYLAHSAKGKEWKNHKYLYKVNGQYIYADDMDKATSKYMMNRRQALRKTKAKMQKDAENAPIRKIGRALYGNAVEGAKKRKKAIDEIKNRREYELYLQGRSRKGDNDAWNELDQRYKRKKNSDLEKSVADENDNWAKNELSRRKNGARNDNVEDFRALSNERDLLYKRITILNQNKGKYSEDKQAELNARVEQLKKELAKTERLMEGAKKRIGIEGSVNTSEFKNDPRLEDRRRSMNNDPRYKKRKQYV